MRRRQYDPRERLMLTLAALIGIAGLTCVLTLSEWNLTGQIVTAPEAFTELGAHPSDTPDYDVRGVRESEDGDLTSLTALLIDPDVTTDEAGAALADYVHDHDGDAQAIEAEVLTSRQSEDYVCRVRYAVDQHAAETLLYDVAVDYPFYSLDCPDQ